MIFEALPLTGAFRVTPEPRGDSRGAFARIYCDEEFAAEGLCTQWLQMNLSSTALRGTLRGLHFQRPPREEIKLVRCARGEVFDVIVDLRAGSATFGQWYGERLDSRTQVAIYVPAGFAHGFQTLTDTVEVSYMHSARYAPGHEGGVIWSDPELAIDWPLEPRNLSARDQNFPPLTETDPITL